MADKRLPYDPHLKKVMKKIRKILEHNDVTGFITIYSESHADFLNQVEASWSVMKFESNEKDHIKVRFRSKRADFETKEDQDRCTKATVGMIMSSMDIAKLQYNQMYSIGNQLREHIRILHPVLNEDDIYTGDGEETDT